MRDLGYKFYKFSLLMFLMLVSALNYNLFINSAKIVAGGTNGISIILENLFGFNSALVILVVSVVTLMFAFLLKEYDLGFSAFVASFVYPFFVQLTSSVSSVVNIGFESIIIISIISGALTGLVSGFLCKHDISQGGITLICQLIYKKFNISISTSNFLINTSIVILGGYIFGFNSILYAFIFLYISRMVMDRIILGTSQKKVCQIITSFENEIKNYISNELEADYTVFPAIGGYDGKKKMVIMTTVSNRDYFRLKEGINRIDKDAFVVITDSYQVKGGK